MCEFSGFTPTRTTGVELGGSLKTLLPWYGIADGLGFGDNTKAAMTRGLAEITRLGIATGPNRHIFRVVRCR